MLERTDRGWAAAVIMAGALRCSPDSGSVLGQMHLVTTASDGPSGFTCSTLDGSQSSSSGGSSVDDFWMREKANEAGLALTVGTYDEVLVRKVYDRHFVARREVDRFVITTRDGLQYAFVYWGAESCAARCPPAPFEPLPGDPWGCATTADAGEAPSVSSSTGP